MGLIAENKVNSTHQAQAGPEVIEFDPFSHVEHGERYKDHEGDDFLGNLELCQRKLGMTDAVRRYLKKVFRQSDAPAEQRSDPPGFIREIAQMGIPGKGHENIRQDQEADKLKGGWDPGKQTGHGVAI
jgi:hypothetical protein